MMNKVAIVTGANKGIGFAIVKALCTKFNGTIVLCSRNEERGKNALKELNNLGLSPELEILDIDDLDSIKSFKNRIEKKYGGIDVLVNNAAIAYPMKSTVPFIKQAQDTINTNYFSLVNVCENLFPLLRSGARVVNVSSSAGMLCRVQSEEIKKKFTNSQLTVESLNEVMKEYLLDVKNGCHEEKGWPRTSYSTSKVGVTALTFIQQKLFDNDPRKDIIINAVHPGHVVTDMSGHQGDLNIDQGADAPVYCALLPPNTDRPKGDMVWYNRKIVDWHSSDNI